MDIEEDEFRSPKKRKFFEDDDDRMIDIRGPIALRAVDVAIPRPERGPAPVSEIVAFSTTEEKQAYVESLQPMSRKQKKIALAKDNANRELQKQVVAQEEKEIKMDI